MQLPNLSSVRVGWYARPLSLFVPVVIFAAIGLWTVFKGSAAIPTASLEVENGGLTSGATSVVDTTASGAKGVKFTASYTYRTLTNPARTEVYKNGSLVATFTNNARTVVLVGPSRTFAEASTTTARVTTTNWVRVAPTAFNGTVNTAWLTGALNDTSPDLFQLSMQYIDQAPAITNSSGLKIAGDADYGPLQPDGTRAEGSDFNDYLGISWDYGTSVDQPEAAQLGSLDCSGYMRMIWGYRTSVPLTLNLTASALPRRAVEMFDTMPGIVTVANSGAQATDMSAVAPGDFVFFDADAGDGSLIDHVGMFLGLDSENHYRFISSRKTANGPTMGDVGGKSILDGTGYYASAFRGVRRL